MSSPDLAEAMLRLGAEGATFHAGPQREGGTFRVYAERLLFVRDPLCAMIIRADGPESLRDARYRAEALACVLNGMQALLQGGDVAVQKAVEKERAIGQLLVAVLGLIEREAVDEAESLIEAKLMQIYGARHLWPHAIGEL